VASLSSLQQEGVRLRARVPRGGCDPEEGGRKAPAGGMGGRGGCAPGVPGGSVAAAPGRRGWRSGGGCGIDANGSGGGPAVGAAA
jgi:hypothetical protein